MASGEKIGAYLNRYVYKICFSEWLCEDKKPFQKDPHRFQPPPSKKNFLYWGNRAAFYECGDCHLYKEKIEDA